MNSTDRGDPNDRPHRDCGEVQGRYPTAAEWEDLIEDAKAFKRRHEKTFRILSESEGHE